MQRKKLQALCPRALTAGHSAPRHPPLCRFSAFLIGVERGVSAEKLHMQCVFKVTGIKSAAVLTKILRKKLTDHSLMGMPAPAHLKISSWQRAGKGVHTWLGMLGYCTKDEGQSHYFMITKNVSEEARAPPPASSRVTVACAPRKRARARRARP